MPRVSPEYAQNHRCPRCGGPLRFIGRWYDNPITGACEFQQEPEVYRSKFQVSDSDTYEPQDGKPSDWATGRPWVHVVHVSCLFCNVDYNRSDVEAGRPISDRKLQIERARRALRKEIGT